MPPGTISRAILASLDWMTKTVRGNSPETADEEAEHLMVGQRGEEIAYFYLRDKGYTVVARNWRNPRRKGEIDIVAWDSDVLCFVEVKTRTKKTLIPAETAVDRDKMKELIGMSRLYLRQLPVGTRFRFDVVTVYLLEGKEPEITLFKEAFGWRTLQYNGETTF